MSSGATGGQTADRSPFRYWKHGLVLAVLSAVLAFCLPTTVTYRYRLTLEIETPEGLKTGTGVIENRWVSHVFTVRGVSLQCTLSGEAVVVDLGTRGVVFSTLNERMSDGRTHAHAGYGCDLPLKVVGRLESRQEDRQRRLARGGVSVDLLPAEVPLLVRFRALNEPMSVEDIDPQNLTGRLGPGVRLRRVHFETTSDAVTGGQVARLLPWLSTRTGQLDLSTVVHIANYSLANSLSTASFRQDDRK